MREPGSILLISCYELGHQPMGLASPLGFLRRAGHAAAALDISRSGLDEAAVRRARFVGISVPMHTALRLGVRVAQRVREINRHCQVCFFGLYATLNADYLLRTCADSVAGGEYEEDLVDLVRSLDEDGPRRSTLRRLDFAVPSRDGLAALDQYARIDRGRNGRAPRSGGLVGYVEASRGCLHHCLHCPIPPVYGGRFFVVPREVVLADIRNLVRAGAEHITFGDPDFLNGPKHSLAIVRAMHAEFPRLTFDLTAKVEHLLKHRTMLPELAALGCAFVVSAVESLSDTVLANLEKGHTRADVCRLLDIMRSCGLPLRPSLVSFTPWTTLDDYLDVLDFVETEGLIDHVDPVQFTIRLLVPPGSGLLARPAIRPFLGELDQPAFSYRWTHPDPRMDRLHQQVSRLVEHATRAGEDPAVTFERLCDLAFAAHRQRRPARSNLPLLIDRLLPPRLTEPWFC